MKRIWWVPLAFAGALSAASSGLAAPCSDPAPLSRFDYLVLASMADSKRPFSLATYRPQRRASPEATRIERMDGPPKSATSAAPLSH
ncbi:MAG TPA: hypothetical protein VK523_03670 [Steroidobacteraceae bacterium]|nr:hypothetical protein [Steroidobacteraceae bacterium]